VGCRESQAGAGVCGEIEEHEVNVSDYLFFAVFGAFCAGAYGIGVLTGSHSEHKRLRPKLDEARDDELKSVLEYADPWAKANSAYSPTMARFIWAIERREHRK
jgi:hypothetical protein